MDVTPVRTETAVPIRQEACEADLSSRLDGGRAVVVGLVLSSAFWILVYMVWRLA